VEGAAAAYGVASSLEIAGGAVTLPVCRPLVDEIAGIMRGLPGAGKVTEVDSPSGSEDCTVLMRRVVERGGEAAFFLFGCNHNGHHRADFDIQDEQSLPMAFDVFTAVALKKNGLKPE
ncbi:MAG: amidohydrolase, partial [Duodenibacillus sp.]|nr:amidohydrolase [Duodenibacillus sp.]